MNRKIKSLIVAGLVILGMGFAKVDSYAAEITNNITEFNFVDVDGGPLMSTHELENGDIKIDIRNVSGYSGHPKGTYQLKIKYLSDKYTITGLELNGDLGIRTGFTFSGPVTEDGKQWTTANITATQIADDIPLTEVKLHYDVADNAEEGEEGEQEQQPEGDGKVDAPPYIDIDSVYEQYKINMAALGDLNNNIRTIEEDSAISKETWVEFVNNFNNIENLMSIEEESDGVYKVYVSLDGNNKEEVETINIKFFNSDKKGWLPEITPGTGQALAVGGIVVGAVAVVGLLVNNKKDKDEE